MSAIEDSRFAYAPFNGREMIVVTKTSDDTRQRSKICMDAYVFYILN